MHPSQNRLLELSESLEMSGATVDSRVAAHVAKCAKCRQEVDGIRATIVMTESAGSIAPSRELRAQILLAARREQKALRDASSGSSPFRVHPGRVGAAVLVLTIVAAGVALSTDVVPIGEESRAPRSAAVSPIPATVSVPAFAADPLQATPEELILQPAVNSPYWQPQTSLERARKRAIQAYDQDFSEAMDAYEKNLFLLQARESATLSRAKKRAALKTLYVERSL